MANDREPTEITTTFLEMLAAPGATPRPAPAGSSILPVEHITLRFYRFLYNGVGNSWNWHDRVSLEDSSLSTLVHAPGLEIFVLYVHGSPAGYSEIDFLDEGGSKLVYFGLFPEFIGKGLGGYFLEWTVRKMWKGRQGVQRIWLHTCTLDHPAALDTYQKAGFAPYKTLTERNPYLGKAAKLS